MSSLARARVHTRRADGYPACGRVDPRTAATTSNPQRVTCLRCLRLAALAAGVPLAPRVEDGAPDVSLRAATDAQLRAELARRSVARAKKGARK